MMWGYRARLGLVSPWALALLALPGCRDTKSAQAEQPVAIAGDGSAGTASIAAGAAPAPPGPAPTTANTAGASATPSTAGGAAASGGPTPANDTAGASAPMSRPAASDAGTSGGATPASTAGASAPVSPADPANAAGSGDGWTQLQTPEFEVPAGNERSLCYAQTLEHAMNIAAFAYEARPGVHHFLFAKTLSPEQDGLFECDVLFRSSWVPIFGAGNGNAELAIPAGAAQILPAGTQLLFQLHLLNVQSEAVRDRVTIRMRESTEADPKPVGIYAFGTDQIALERGPGSATNDCVLPEDVQLFGLLPHMHYLGTQLTFEIGPDAGALSEVFRREPWNFDRQVIEPFALTIPAGTLTRTICHYDNTTNAAVGFGESSHDEMCFLVGYRVGHDGLAGCVQYGGDAGASGPTETAPVEPDAGMCGDQLANNQGIGAVCTKGGGECTAGLSCSVDQGQTPAGTPGFCLRIGGCATDADCGDGNVTCCGTAESAGLVPICIPEACRPDNCIPR